MTKLDINQIISVTRKKRKITLSHPNSPHCYTKIVTPNGHEQFICTLPKCSHSLNIAQWIIGKENLCQGCYKPHIIQEDKELKCEDCLENEDNKSIDLLD